MKNKKYNIPQWSTIEFNTNFPALTAWFYDKSRVVIYLASGNPLAMYSFSARGTNGKSHAERFTECASSAEYFNKKLYIKFKNGTTYEGSLDDFPINRKLPAKIIEKIRSRCSEFPDHECQIFIGDLFPNHHPLTLERMAYLIDQPESEFEPAFTAILELEIADNLFIAVLWTAGHARPVEDALTLVGESVYKFLSITGFYSGAYYHIAVSHVLNLENEVIFEYEKTKWSEDFSKEVMAHYLYVLQTFTSEKSWYISFALADFKFAVSDPQNAGFGCRRALEALTHHIGFSKGLTSKSQRWDALKEIIKMDEATFEEIKEYAGNERHGDHRGISPEIYQRFLFETRKGIGAYMDWVSEML